MPESRQRRRHGRPVSRAAAIQTALRPRKRKVNKLYLLASALIAILVIAGFAIGGIGLGGGQRAIPIDTGNNGSYVEGVGIQQSLAGNSHVTEGQTVEYTGFPPTSGDHWPPHVLRRCGFYDQGLPDEVVVHHLEHGNIVVSYNLVGEGQVEELRRAMGDIGIANLWGIARAYDKIPQGQVAVAAWGVLDVMDGVDAARIGNFFEYAGNLGPEQLPCR